MSNQLSVEEITENEETLIFKSDVVQTQTRAIWKLTDMREHWRLHLGSEPSGGPAHLRVEVDGSVIPFEFKLDFGDADDRLRFTFKPVNIVNLRKTVKIYYLYGTAQIQLLDKDGNVWHTDEIGPVNWLWVDETDPYLEQDFYSEKHFSLDTLLSDQVLGEDDALTAIITFSHSVSRKEEHPSAAVLQTDASKSISPSLRDEMEALLKDASDADVQLKMKDGTVLQAHKLILSARSPVFKRMFDGDFVEKDGTVTIPDLSSKVMNVLLHYIYTEKLHPDWKMNVAELLNGANRYNLQGLLHYCDYLMIALCNEYNAEDLLAIAKLHTLERATSDIEKYIIGIKIE